MAIRLFLTACVALTALGAAWAEKGPKVDGSQPEIHYAPRENLESLDAREIGRVQLSIDMAAYVLSDLRIIAGLTDAAERGVLIRLYLDRAVDGAMLRTGSGNFSRSGLASQDNDAIFITDPAVVDAFESNFERIWARAHNIEALNASH